MSRVLRVAQVANYVGPTSGGLAVVLDTVGGQVLDGGGYRLRCVPGAIAGREHDLRDLRVRVAGPRLPASGGSYRVMVGRRALVEELLAFGPDLIEVHDQTTLAWLGDWARSRSVASVLFSHERLDLIAAEATGLTPARTRQAGRWWAARLASRFDAVVCASQFAAQPFLDVAAPNIHRVPFGVDLTTFAPRPRVGSSPWSPGRLRLVLASRLHPEKDPHRALDVLGRLLAEGVAAQLVVLGTGPLEQAMRRRVRRERLPVEFLGHVSDRQQVASILAGAQVALAPGPRETFALSVLEAMACGTPVVTSTEGAARELLIPGAGVAAGTAAEMARGVRELAVAGRPAKGLRGASSPAAAHPGAMARARAEHFDWAVTFRGLEQVRAAASEARREGQPASLRRPRLVSKRSNRSRTSIAAHTRLRPPPETSVSTPASTSRSTAR